MSEWVQGQVAFVDRAPYGIDKVEVTRVTPTLVRIAGSSMTFTHDGRAKGMTGFHCPRLRQPDVEMQRRYRAQQAESALHTVHRRLKEGKLTDGEMRQILAMAGVSE